MSSPSSLPSSSSATNQPKESLNINMNIPTNSSSSQSLSTTDSTMDCESILAEAHQLFLQKKYEKATIKYSIVAETYAQRYGPLHPKCADLMYRYGLALLNHAIKKSGVLGDSEQVRNATGKREKDLLTVLDNSVAADLAPSKPASRFHFDDANEDDLGSDDLDEGKGDENEGEQDEEEEGEEADEEEKEEDLEADDFEIAFEVLDVARVIYTYMLNGEIEKEITDLRFDGKGKEKVDVDLIIKQKLAEVISTLADVSLESESFSQAIEDYQTALAMRQEFVSPSDRRLAETHYKLALAIEYGGQSLELALTHLKSCRSVMVLHRSELTSSNYKERMEIDDLIAELDLKIEDLEHQIYLRDHPEEQEKFEDPLLKKVNLMNPSTNINDLSGLVKKKSSSSSSSSSSSNISSTVPTSFTTPSPVLPSRFIDSEEHKRKRSLEEEEEEEENVKEKEHNSNVFKRDGMNDGTQYDKDSTKHIRLH